MGEFLTVGIKTQVSVAKAQNLTPKQIENAIDIDTTIFDFQDTKDYWKWSPKPAIITEELIPFLEAVYADLYGENSRSSDYKDVLEELKQLAPEEWLAFAQDGSSYEAFQSNNYGFPYKVKIQLENGKTETIKVSEETIMFALEGKISMECYGLLFSFFEKALREKYKKFRLSKLFTIEIVG